MGRILVVDDEKNMTLVIQAILEKAGLEVVSVNQGSEALLALQKTPFEVLLTDLYMPQMTGIQLLEECQKLSPRLPVVLMTAFGTVEVAVNALKKGAFDFVTKPFDQVELVQIIQKALSVYREKQKEFWVPPLVKKEESGEFLSLMIGQSQPMKELRKVIAKIASSPSTVLIWGESGTGKELVASEIHQRSDRESKPFIKVNCAAIPASLIESELFGYEKGAFTGAVTSKPGRFELAHEGTLFLDEVGEMSLEMQVKLLRVLQDQEFERVGGISSLQVNVRIITATNKDLVHEMKEGRFREDLFYRLNVVPLYLPSLKERVEDIELLIYHFIQQFNLKLKKKMLGLTPACLSCLKSFSWPGNIRQLENVIERMMLMCDGTELSLEDLPEEILKQDPLLDLKDSSIQFEDGMSLKEIIRQKTLLLERGVIEKTLEEMHGNVTRTAEKLGISRKGLQLKMKELKLKRFLD